MPRMNNGIQTPGIMEAKKIKIMYDDGSFYEGRGVVIEEIRVDNQFEEAYTFGGDARRFSTGQIVHISLRANQLAFYPWNKDESPIKVTSTEDIRLIRFKRRK